MDLPFIYRIHSDPSPEKISDFVNLLKILGYRLNTRINEITPIKMQHILTEISDKKEFKVLSSLLLRSMKKAEYSKENISKNISQNIHLRFFPREVRTFDLVKPEFKNNNTYTPNALERLSEPRHQRELQEQERHFDYSYGDDLFSF